MNIAVIDNDTWWRRRLIDFIEPEDSIDFFSTHEEFGKAKLSKYDIIFIEYALPKELNGEEIAKSLEGKTRASIALMGCNFNWISKNIVTNGNIKAVLDKDRPHQFIRFLNSEEHKNETYSYFNKAMEEINKIKEFILS